jgi:hypothetical protein
LKKIYLLGMTVCMWRALDAKLNRYAIYSNAKIISFRRKYLTKEQINQFPMIVHFVANILRRKNVKRINEGCITVCDYVSTLTSTSESVGMMPRLRTKK